MALEAIAAISPLSTESFVQRMLTAERARAVAQSVPVASCGGQLSTNTEEWLAFLLPHWTIGQ